MVEAEGSRIVVIEALDEVLRGQGPTTGRTRLDARCLVDLVAQRGDFTASACADVADVERGAPMEPKAQHHVARGDVAPHRDLVDGRPESAGRGDARASGRRLRSRGLDEEERDDAVADMAAHQAARVDHAPVGGSHQASSECEVRARRQAASELGRPFQVGEQDRGRPPGGSSHVLHPLEVAGVELVEHRGHGPHPDRRLRDDRGADQTACGIGDAHDQEVHVTGSGAFGRPDHCSDARLRRRLQRLDQVMEQRIDRRPDGLPVAVGVGEDQVPAHGEQRALVLVGIRTEAPLATRL